jgi:hypothetical protein
MLESASSVSFSEQDTMDNEARETAENTSNFEFESNHPSDDGSGNRRWRKVTGATAVTLVVILTLVLAARGSGALSPGTVSTANSSNTTSTPSQVQQITGTFQSSPAPALTPPGSLLGPIPARCPSGTTATSTAITEISYYDDPAFGQSPVWVLGLSNEQNQRVVHFESYPPLPYTSHGWRWRILVVSAPGYHGEVTLAGEQTTGSSGVKSTLFMDVGAGLAAQLFLNASRPIMRGLDWAEWPIYVYLPGSGCYHLGAHWPGGSWSINFAAGV